MKLDNFEKNCNYKIAECLNLKDKDKIECKYSISLETIYENQYSDVHYAKDKVDYKIDFKFKEKTIVKIYGEVKENGICLENKIIVLYKEIQRGYSTEVVEVGKTLTDYMGIFTFIQPYCEENIIYRVKVA